MNLKDKVTENWLCIDCGTDTAPGCPSRAEVEKAIANVLRKDVSVSYYFDDRSEVYCVREAVWKAARMPPFGGCLCIGCLEKRLGRRLKPRDFIRDHPFSTIPGTDRLLERRGWSPHQGR